MISTPDNNKTMFSQNTKKWSVELISMRIYTKYQFSLNFK